VQSRVLNMKTLNPDINHQSISNSLIEQFFKYYGSQCEIEILDTHKLRQIDSLNRAYEQLKDWNWRFGTTPDFNHHMETRFDWGIMDVHIDVSGARIKEVEIFSDCLYPKMIDELKVNLKGIAYDPKEIGAALDKVEILLQNNEMEIAVPFAVQFKQWLITQL